MSEKRPRLPKAITGKIRPWPKAVRPHLGLLVEFLVRHPEHWPKFMALAGKLGEFDPSPAALKYDALCRKQAQIGR